MTSLAQNPLRQRSARPSRSSIGAALVLVVILTGQLMIMLDATIVTIALPKISDSLHFSPTSLSWVQNAYTLTFGGLLLLGARAGDILGRRRMFMVGIGLFTVTSLLGGLAQSSGELLAARAAQGIGAAIAAPSTLALLTSRFTEGPDCLRAFGLYGAVSSGGASVGLVAGGVLTDWLSWRWGLFINVPIGIALILLTPRYLPETPRQPGRFDLAGAVTSTLGMASLVYGFVRAASDGWGDTGTALSFIVGVALLAMFVMVELRAEQPITPLHLFASRQRSASYVARLLLVGGMFGMFFFLTQYLQLVRDYSPLKAGFAFLPMTVALFASVRTVPKLIPRVGGMRFLLSGIASWRTRSRWRSRDRPSSWHAPWQSSCSRSASGRRRQSRRKTPPDRGGLDRSRQTEGRWGSGRSGRRRDDRHEAAGRALRHRHDAPRRRPGRRRRRRVLGRRSACPAPVAVPRRWRGGEPRWGRSTSGSPAPSSSRRPVGRTRRRSRGPACHARWSTPLAPRAAAR